MSLLYRHEGCKPPPTAQSQRQRAGMPRRPSGGYGFDDTGAWTDGNNARQTEARGTEVKTWRERIQAIRSVVPPWMAARLRAMMASLHIG
jgi:hypothetical protein